MEAQEDSCKARGNRSGKLPEVVIAWKHRPEQRMDNNYCCIARGIMKNTE